MANNTPKKILLHALQAVAGLFVFSVGVYCTIQANIGVAPWDAFNLGLSKTFGIQYGTASIAVSLLIVAVDLLLREKIGLGMLLDSLLVGKFVDLLNWINILPKQNRLWLSLIVILAGLTVMGFGQAIYMSAALGCGPRDSMLVGLKRRTEKIPIGVISIAIMAVVTLIGWLLGGPIGIGTVLCAALVGPIMQLVFRIVRYVPTDTEHQDILTSFRILFKKRG